MTTEIRINNADLNELQRHLTVTSDYFIPPLHQRVDIAEYALKLVQHTCRFEVWNTVQLIGLVAVYLNNKNNKTGFITSVSVEKEYRGQGLARQLVHEIYQHCLELGFNTLELEVNEANTPAQHLYQSEGFVVYKTENSSLFMKKQLGGTMSQRNYNQELKDNDDRNYAYSFDFDVIHPYMIKSFMPFFQNTNVLELGSYKGDFTKRLLPLFKDITCVEAATEAIQEAKGKLPADVTIINSTFEHVQLSRVFDNIILTHVLEHLDAPVALLQRVNKEWLSDKGRLLLVCPNANAPSRQIAVKMGLITHNAAVTPAEAEHGHRCTYSLDTLERDAVAAGLKVVHRSGIFFKALANFQWDRLLQTDIISPAYLDGCYKLGQQYPDLCSSIFLVCEKG